MLKDNKILIHGGAVLASAAVCATVLPSEGEVCLNKRLMCAPMTIHLSDIREDGSRAPGHSRPLTVAISSAVATGALYVPVYAAGPTIWTDRWKRDRD
jgi:hypothetical protein